MFRKPLAIAAIAIAATGAMVSTEAAAGDAGVGALLGAAIGAASGHNVDGRHGAVVGGMLGAVTGASIAANSRGYHEPDYYTAPPAYYPPAPVRYVPPPVVVRPAPVYYAPPAVVVQPRPVVVHRPVHVRPVYAPVVVDRHPGWRHERRDDWRDGRQERRESRWR